MFAFNFSLTLISTDYDILLWHRCVNRKQEVDKFTSKL